LGILKLKSLIREEITRFLERKLQRTLYFYFALFTKRQDMKKQ